VTAGYESYFPVYKRRLHRRYGGDVFSPLFSRYVFVKTHVCGSDPHFSSVNGFLTNEDIPPDGPDQVIEDIRKDRRAANSTKKPNQTENRQVISELKKC